MISHWDDVETVRGEVGHIGARGPSDIGHYQRSNKIVFRGIGVIARLDHIEYEVGEESAT